MKILMVTRFPVGGIRTFFRYVYSQSAFDDCEIVLLAPGEGLAEYLASHVSKDRFQVRQAPSKAVELLGSIRQTLQGERFHLLHSHGLTAGVLAELGRFGTKIPHLLTVHDVFLPSTFPGLSGQVRKIALSQVVRRCDAIHAVSYDCARNFIEYLPGINERRVHPILNGIDVASIHNAIPIDGHAELGLPPDTKLVGFFGRFMAQKGFRNLVNAVEILVAQGSCPQFKVVTFGWGGFIREDYDYLRSKGLADVFVQLPHTDEPYRWMKAIDLIVMPSRWEACGLVAMEALVSGTPTIGTSCIGLREVLDGSPAVSVEPDDPAALSTAIAQSLSSSPRKRFSEYKDRASERFDVRRCSAGIRQLYEVVKANDLQRAVAT